MDPTAPPEHAVQAWQRLRDWAVQQAYPLWSTAGIDWQAGGVFEKLDLHGAPTDVPRRARVQPRQIYSFVVAPELGWTGPSQTVANHALDFFKSRFFRPDGLVSPLVLTNGEPIEASLDLYDQSFAIFGLAMAHRGGLWEGARIQADLLRDRLAGLSHPLGGYREPSLSQAHLFSNPQMHMLEACLEWAEQVDDPRWDRTAHGIAELALARLIDPQSGGVREFFDENWSPLAGDEGKILEPGHQFEWGWLLLRCGKRWADDRFTEAAMRLIKLGRDHGVDQKRGVAFNQMLTDFSVRDASARLWPQTEWLKAASLAAEITADPQWWDEACKAAAALEAYLIGQKPGLWADRIDEQGRVILEPSPASSFYHIICAILEFGRSLKRSGAQAG
jgi:mannose/cellobiose epimerase-like protein (N-acyl-D-glucosamine 2-epimerase family)